MIKKGIVEEDDVLRGKGIDPDEKRLEEAIVSRRAEAMLSVSYTGLALAG